MPLFELTSQRHPTHFRPPFRLIWYTVSRLNNTLISKGEQTSVTRLIPFGVSDNGTKYTHMMGWFGYHKTARNIAIQLCSNVARQ